MRANALIPALAILSGLGGCAPKPAPVVAPSPSPTPAVSPVAPPVVLMAAPQPPVALCDRGVVRPTFDGRLFNHFRYGEMPAISLAPAPVDLSADGSCRVHPAMLADLKRLLAAAGADATVAGQLRAVSCHRSQALQDQTFCAGIGPNGSGSFAERAWASAPPGYSEHATGYVVDFGTRDRNGCPDAEACFGATAAGRWLRDNAARFGFEMSFPAGNRQQVKWEPWHWRWVGTSASAPGAAMARATFAAARARFPADPAPAQ